MNPRAISIICLALCFVTTSCSKPIGPPREKTTKVAGTILVNGKPVAGVTVLCHRESDAPKPPPPIPAPTDASGKFCFTTYDVCDGLPDGNYSLTFRWVTMMSAQKDLFDGQYSDAKSSQHKFTVKDRTPIDLGTIDLKAENPSS